MTADIYYKLYFWDFSPWFQNFVMFSIIPALHHGLSSSMSSYNVNERPFQTSPDRKINKISNDENDTEMDVTTADESSSKN